MTVPFIEQNDQTLVRHEHLEALRALVGNVYPNKFVRSDVTGTASHEDTITSIIQAFKRYEPAVKEGEKPSPEVLESANGELNKIRVRIAGRIAAPPRVMGKAAFVHLSDGVRVCRYTFAGRMSSACGTMLTVAKWALGAFSLLDHGDFIGVGVPLRDQDGELSCTSRSCSFSPRLCSRCRTRCTASTILRFVSDNGMRT
jgi:lysyl-tRNA synthetase class II